MLERLAQVVLSWGLRTRGPLARRAVRAIRRSLIRAGDPPVTYELAPRYRLALPLSHDLPYYRRLYPTYAQNIVDIGRLVKSKYADATCIDIGANVGDTAVLLHAMADGMPILCIEGDPVFLQYLRRNVVDLPEVSIAPVYVGATGTTGHVVWGRGTARIEVATGGTPIATRSLDDILADYPRFQRSRLIKIDTDGMDVAIIHESIGWLAAVRPVLFLEYDPVLGKLSASDSAGLWRALQEIGYEEAAFYENTGELLGVVRLTERRLLEDLHFRFARTNGVGYADVCLLSRDDEDLAEPLRARGRGQ